MNRSLASVQQKLDGFKTGMAAIRDVFLTYQVGKFIGEQFKYAASLGETAQQLGITSKQLQVYSSLAGQAGVEQADLETGITKLTSSLGKAALGAQEPAKAFAALGVSIRDSNGHVKTAGTVFPEIADKLAKIADPAQRAAAEVAIFGRSGQKLDNILTTGSQGLADYARYLQDTGQIIDDGLINKADKAADRIEQLNKQLHVSVAKVVAENANAILALANALASATGRAVQFISQYPRLSAALAGAAVGMRVGGLPGALAGAGVGGIIADRAGHADTDAVLAKRNQALTLGMRNLRGYSLNGDQRQRAEQILRDRVNKRYGVVDESVGPLGLRQSRVLPRPAAATPVLPTLPAAGGENLPEFLKSGGGGGSKRTPRAPKDRTDENVRQYQDQLARLNDDLLSAKRDNVVDAGQLADIARKQVTVEADKLNADIAEMAAKNPIIAAHAEELRNLVAQAAAQKQLTISSEQLARENDDLLQVQLAANDNQKDMLHAQQSLATTAADRLPIALQLLDLDKQEERLRLQAIVDRAKIGQATAAEAQAAQARLGTLDQIYATREASTRRDNEGPLKSYIRDISKTGAQMNEALQSVTVGGLQSFTDGLADAIVNFKSLGNVAKQVLSQMLADFLKLSLQKGLSSLLGSLFGGGSSKASLKLAARAAGGPVGAGIPYLVGENGPELMVPGASGTIVPNHRISTPSYSPRGNSRLDIVPSPLFDVYVDGKLQKAAPVIASLGASEAQTRMARNVSRRVA